LPNSFVSGSSCYWQKPATTYTNGVQACIAGNNVYGQLCASVYVLPMLISYNQEFNAHRLVVGRRGREAHAQPSFVPARLAIMARAAIAAIAGVGYSVGV
jgi:hypothetical protein